MITLQTVKDAVHNRWWGTCHALREFIQVDVLDAEATEQVEIRAATFVDEEICWAKSCFAYSVLPLLGSSTKKTLVELLSEAIDGAVEAVVDQMIDRLHAVGPGTLQ